MGGRGLRTGTGDEWGGDLEVDEGHREVGVEEELLYTCVENWSSLFFPPRAQTLSPSREPPEKPP